MDLKEIQEKIGELFGEEDKISGTHLLVSVLAEEVGELARATRGKGNVDEEAADIIFITLSIANLHNVDVYRVFQEKYLSRMKDEISSSWKDVVWK